MQLPIYMDNHATTRVDSRVLQAMMPFLTEAYGNAASRSHGFGWAADQAVEKARAQVAKLIGASAREIVFTSGATESDNLAITGAVQAQGGRGHVITQATEHNAVLDTCRWLEKHGTRITVLPVDAEGLIQIEDLRRALEEEKPVLVTILAANNEIGTLQPVDEIGALCHERGVLFHTDAAQTVGKVPVDVNRSQIDLLSISGHKIYGPKGVGALYIRRRNPRVELVEQMHGGGHERGMRSGTLNVPGIVGLGAACEIAGAELEAEAARLSALRDRLQAKIEAGLDRVKVNGAKMRRLPGNLNMTFEQVDSETLMMGLKDVALSSGSACTSAKIEPSHVLRALGLSEEAAHSSIRFGLGRFNTEEEVDYVAERLVDVVKKLRELSPEYAELA
ncbi:MAG TPA: IscS subfamily cysteine desulfurase [Acidobacteriaceae bacterium]|jgi:cysteine desulfurase